MFLKEYLIRILRVKKYLFLTLRSLGGNFISWQNWIPDYVRNEIRKKINVNVDGHGNVIEKNAEKDKDAKEVDFFGTKALKNKEEDKKGGKNKNYKDVDSYKPSGNKVYSDIFLNFE